MSADRHVQMTTGSASLHLNQDALRILISATATAMVKAFSTLTSKRHTRILEQSLVAQLLYFVFPSLFVAGRHWLSF